MSVANSTTSWGFDIHDAGPPVSFAFCVGWVGVTALAYLLFTVVRPAALRHGSGGKDAAATTPGTVGHMWLPSQLFYMTWAWCLLDGVHRTYSYVLLSPTMLWRRGMLPLAPRWSAGFWSSWVNLVRFAIHCRSVWPGTNAALATPQCRAYSLPLAATHDEEERDDMYATVVPPFASEAHRDEDTHQYHLLAVYSVVTTLAMVVVVTSGIRRFQRLWRGPGQTDTTTPRDDSGRAASENSPSQADQEQRDSGAKTDSTFKTAHSEFYVHGADDAWLDSAEAAAEFARAEQDKETDKRNWETVAATSRRGQMHQVIHDTWPTLLAVAYGGLYAATGGMPLLMVLLFPAVSVVAIASALYCSWD